MLDVGSGAGLPGLVLAIARPDLTVTLIEPLARRTSFLIEAVERLGLAKTVRVFRGRADEAATGRAAGSRSAATWSPPARSRRWIGSPRWCLPLAVRGGRLLALKGASAADEIDEHAEVGGAARRRGAGACSSAASA